jgi:hypothetical protein
MVFLKVLIVWLSLKTLCLRVWHHLLVTAAFLAPWQAFNEQRQQWLLTLKSMYG